MKRPDHLPNFSDPPLDEVVLGVQFTPVPHYSSVHAARVWKLFSDQFPSVQEQPILEPQFETFGGSNTKSGAKIHVGSFPVGSRLWFLSQDQNHLIQFQPDRFITNWRKQPNTQPYPRFEGLASSFEESFKTLSSHLEANFNYQMDVNQAEVAYINVIPVEAFSMAGEWLKLWNSGNISPEALNISFNEVVYGNDGRPFARLGHQIQSVFTANGRERAFRLSLSFKGKPQGRDIDAAMSFLKCGREAIVTRFGEITTEHAQKIWGRVK